MGTKAVQIFFCAIAAGSGVLAFAAGLIYDQGIAAGRRQGIAELSRAITCRDGVTDPMTVLEIGSDRYIRYQKILEPSPQAKKSAEPTQVVVPKYCEE
jgi:hypothetical protein